MVLLERDDHNIYKRDLPHFKFKENKPYVRFMFLTFTVETAHTCTSPTRGVAWDAPHISQMEKGFIDALRNTSHPCQATKQTTLQYTV